ncbi:CHASE2 domain-containing protein [Nostocaceae cyanobacterium CENA369]|uniref:CHASE2 domain-containing protein n=1 Tax=Dendronalium phyllosphericum CENA369 TaxID=1725256 RepID=A0A8J7LCB0_9NOST|nr:CHASE2 domain-containing protein [Dendronalium phyllosphericum]MBH8571766.1 CHASE2 domain-containing protein [Dendronalium phyllosphericum CENA369]
MSKLVILNLGKGNLHSGFPFVNVQLFYEKLFDERLHEEGNLQWKQLQGNLPASPILSDLYCRWQLLYKLIYESRYINVNLRQSQLRNEDIKIDDTDVTHFSDVDFYQVCHELQKQIDIWLDAEEFRHIERQLRMQLSSDDEIRFIIQSEDILLRKLPWHLWRFFSDYPKAEIGLSSIEFGTQTQVKKHTQQVKILAVLGDSKGIDIDTDRKILEKLPYAKTVFIVEPKHSELDTLLWDNQGWNILYFAGHSYTNSQTKSGYIHINKNESLNINYLTNALKKALKNGLQIAVFNSCDGLGLAQKLEYLHVPQILVMRERVPDKVAQEFLKHFLTNFAEGQSFYLSVRQAREKLQGLESEFPAASWLPVICQNPAEISPTWENLRNGKQELKKSILSSSQLLKIKFHLILFISITVTILLTVIRSFGLLQFWEMKAFDHLMQMRSPESEDSRLLIVGADEKDIRTYGYPLPDAIITRLLDKLQQHQPAAIGLNIVRDLPVPINDTVNHQALINHFQKNHNLMAICAFNNNLEQSIAPPSQSSEIQLGFVDLYDDKEQTHNQDTTVRRYLLSRSENPISEASPCTTKYSLGWRLAYQYLNAKKIPVITFKDDWKFGTFVIQRLEKFSGGYQNLDARGNQLLINYRHTPDPIHIAQQVTLRDILNADSDRFNPAWVKNRVVLIGVVAPSVKDPHQTPYGEMRSLYIHAHVVSQLLSTVEDRRPLLWWLPKWSETLWIFGWSLTGGIVVWRFRILLHRGLVLSICSAILYGFCWSIFSLGGWTPLVPGIIALIAPWGVIWVGNAVYNKQQT